MPIGLTASQSPPYEDRQRIGGDCAAHNPAEPCLQQRGKGVAARPSSALGEEK